jgi:hypothetical protein
LQLRVSPLEQIPTALHLSTVHRASLLKRGPPHIESSGFGARLHTPSAQIPESSRQGSCSWELAVHAMPLLIASRVQAPDRQTKLPQAGTLLKSRSHCSPSCAAPAMHCPAWHVPVPPEAQKFGDSSVPHGVPSTAGCGMHRPATHTPLRHCEVEKSGHASPSSTAAIEHVPLSGLHAMRSQKSSGGVGQETGNQPSRRNAG